jgi:predicted Zn finger-like uncharacterized protein
MPTQSRGHGTHPKLIGLFVFNPKGFIMPQYKCPNCETALKRDQPLPAGKKIKCPKCATVFGPPAGPETAQTKAAAVNAKMADEDDDGRNPYAVKEDEGEEDAMREEKERAAQGLIKDRFKKSKRGPALKEVVRPSNFLLAVGVITCTLALIGVVIGAFPLIFQDFYAEPEMPKGMKYSEWEEKKKQMGKVKMSDEDWRRLVIWRSLIMGINAVYFVVGSFICKGAFKMRSMESRGWGIAGSIIACFTLLGILIGIWCIVVLNNPIVKAGFEEEKPPEA